MSRLTSNALALRPAGMPRRQLLELLGTGLLASSLMPLTGAQAAAARRGPSRAGGALHSANKRLVAQFLHEMASGDARTVLAQYCHADCRFEIFHPFNTIDGIEAAAVNFWQPLRAAFPDYEQRIAFAIGGEYEGRAQVSVMSHIMGTFDAPWIGIPPTRGLAFLRFGFNAIVRDGRIAKAYVLFDSVDLMRQAGFYPFRPMPGSAELWPFPPSNTGASFDSADPVRGAETLRIVREMQVGLPRPDQIKGLATVAGKHSEHWHENMNWYGPAGIGSMRGLRGFRDYHGALFLQAFPDREGLARDNAGPEDGPGHYVRLGDGRYAATGGWPSIRATHSGSEWLGLAPSGKKVEMRVADWYRLDENNKIADNWVLMDIPHIVAQMGLDIFHDLSFRTDRAKLRRPEIK